MSLSILDFDEPAARDHVTKCAACKHSLRAAESRALGVGPDCASKLLVQAGSSGRTAL
ncbi:MULTISPECIES: DUF6011 domain-containing protein [unclassified Nonomuraea]|uniref:DUF6011 domain-containing protein n=1 Tax=Nonomuraea sp. NPDC047529 TaxID=3155623 RepID=UPI0033F629AF